MRFRSTAHWLERRRLAGVSFRLEVMFYPMGAALSYKLPWGQGLMCPSQCVPVPPPPNFLVCHALVFDMDMYHPYVAIYGSYGLA